MRKFVSGEPLSVIDFKRLLLEEWKRALQKPCQPGVLAGVSTMPTWGSCVPIAIVENIGNDFERAGLEIIACDIFPFDLRKIFIKCDSSNRIGMFQLKDIGSTEFDPLSRSILDFAIRHGILREVSSSTNESQVLFLSLNGC